MPKFLHWVHYFTSLDITDRILPKMVLLGSLENRLKKASNTNKKKLHREHTVIALIANCIIFFKHEIQLSVSLVYVIITLESTANNEYISSLFNQHAIENPTLRFRILRQELASPASFSFSITKFYLFWLVARVAKLQFLLSNLFLHYSLEVAMRLQMTW